MSRPVLGYMTPPYECGHFQYYTLIFNNNTAVMFQTRLTSMTLWLFFSSYSIKPDFLRLLLGGLLLLLPLALITFYVSFITVHQKKKKISSICITILFKVLIAKIYEHWRESDPAEYQEVGQRHRTWKCLPSFLQPQASHFHIRCPRTANQLALN